MWCLLSNFYLNMFRASLCPSSGEQEYTLRIWCSALVVMAVVVWSWEASCVHSHHYQCRTPYAAVHTLVLLMMGIMMPETCWDKSLVINIRAVASCWFLSLHPTFMMHGHKSLKNVRKYLCVFIFRIKELKKRVSRPLKSQETLTQRHNANI